MGIPSASYITSIPVVGADLRAALVASCFLGALPPVDLRAVCFVRAMTESEGKWRKEQTQIRNAGHVFRQTQ